MEPVDVLVLGAGHNGLVAATLLARSGLSVRVLEARSVIGGATRTERPFEKVPALGQSTGAYLLGLMPPELLRTLDLDIPLLRRDPHYFLPTRDHRYLLFGSDRAAMEQQFRRFFSDADWRANEALGAELDAFREDVGPTWLEEPLSIEETAERHVRGNLREAFVALCRGSVGDYLDRFGFESDLLKAMYAVTDGFTGQHGGYRTPGTGMNFLIHNMCRLPGADGTWMIVEGGMGTVVDRLATAAQRAGADIVTDRPVTSVLVEGGQVRGVVDAVGDEHRATVVVTGADPFSTRRLLPDGAVPAAFDARLDRYRKDGTTLKLNLALGGLPTFRCLPDDQGQHAGTIHVLPDEGEVMARLEADYAAISAGRLPEAPAIEMYIHSTVDPSLQDPGGHHSAALFVQWVPHTIEGSSWEREGEAFGDHLIGLVDALAPGFGDLVVDRMLLAPPDIEARFGIHRGHIHHVDNSFGFADRMPYAWPIDGLYACSAGCHPGGSVIGAAGHNAAKRILKDLGRQSW